MKKLILLLLLVTPLAQAQSHAKGTGIVTHVEHNYINVTNKVKTNICEPVNVPIYGDGNGNPVVGAIIGGVIGSRFGGGDGKTAATVIGAIAGSEMSRNSNREIIGYKTEEHCRTQVSYVNEKVNNGYTIHYMFNGFDLTTTSDRPYNVGDEIQLNLQVFPLK